MRNIRKIHFARKFGIKPKIAINFDPFGHTRGLVQMSVVYGEKFYYVKNKTEFMCYNVNTQRIAYHDLQGEKLTVCFADINNIIEG